MRIGWRRRGAAILAVGIAAATLSGCGWKGLNSVNLPGTKGAGAGSYKVRIQMADVRNLQSNARVRLDDVPVGSVSKIELQGWHALLTVQLGRDVNLPANTTATVGQPTLLGAPDIELARPTKEPPRGKLRNGSLIPLSQTREYPTVEETLASVSLVFNGGALAQVQDITEAISTALKGKEKDLRTYIEQLNIFTGNLQEQTSDTIAASESINRLFGKFAAQQPVLDRAIKAIPDALKTLNEERDNIVEATTNLGQFGALTADTVNATKTNLVKVLKEVGPVNKALADAGPEIAYSVLGLYASYPFPNEAVFKFQRGESANATAIVDLTLSRIDAGYFTGTRYECNLTNLEMLWGRTVGQWPSPCINPGRFGANGVVSNPIAVPYHADQGP